jgi:hypothetical protein
MLDGGLLSRKGVQAHHRNQTIKSQQGNQVRLGSSAEDAHPELNLHLRGSQLLEL